MVNGIATKSSVGIDETENKLLTNFQVMKQFYNQYQKPVESNDNWFEQFQKNWNTAMATGGESSLIPMITQSSTKYKGKSINEIKEATKAMYIFLQSDCIHYGNEVREIAENLVLGHDNFPMTTDSSYCILADTQQRLDKDQLRKEGLSMWTRTIYTLHYSCERGGCGTRSPRNHENLSTIPLDARLVLGRDWQLFDQCYNCQEWGYFAY